MVGVCRAPLTWRFKCRWSTPIHAIGPLRLTFVTAIFMLPAAYPVTTVVGAPLAFGLVVCPVLLSWFAWSRHWFGGPMPDVLNSDVSGGKSIVCQAGAVVQQVLIHSCSLQIVKVKGWISDPPRTTS